jgi:hypothetical protein
MCVPCSTRERRADTIHEENSTEKVNMSHVGSLGFYMMMATDIVVQHDHSVVPDLQLSTMPTIIHYQRSTAASFKVLKHV